jgi:hypothetical protein
VCSHQFFILFLSQHKRAQLLSQHNQFCARLFQWFHKEMRLVLYFNALYIYYWMCSHFLFLRNFMQARNHHEFQYWVYPIACSVWKLAGMLLTASKQLFQRKSPDEILATHLIHFDLSMRNLLLCALKWGFKKNKAELIHAKQTKKLAETGTRTHGGLVCTFLSKASKPLIKRREWCDACKRHLNAFAAFRAGTVRLHLYYYIVN